MRLWPDKWNVHAGVDGLQGVEVHVHHGQVPLEVEEFDGSRGRVSIPPSTVAKPPPSQSFVVLRFQLDKLVSTSLASRAADIATGKLWVLELALGEGVSLLQLLARIVVVRARGWRIGIGRADVRQQHAQSNTHRDQDLHHFSVSPISSVTVDFYQDERSYEFRIFFYLGKEQTAWLNERFAILY
ncbi:MAG: hypothetical protein A2534_01135 [Candidatus Magasanikbacteria bacterium RIFOXYD2_FULL_39_9]|nr:MAG: hypothetical protein A2534_01135 [Candidatus Magasanikbacteria bacterium RIFOXYD2_FULL_39_9]